MTRLAFAFGAGLLATVNPCGFAMLPAFLGYYVGGEDAGDHGSRDSPSVLGRLAQGFAVGAAVSAGFAGVLATAALVVSAGLRPLVGYVPWAAVVIGFALAGLGLAMIAGRHLGLRLGERLRPGAEHSYRRMAVFGAAYALASLSCTIAVLLAVVAQALSTASLLGMAG
ncbi:MAG: cytochrome c biogenesis CcdA family protein, partial [Acidimicrobiales bacterium]